MIRYCPPHIKGVMCGYLTQTKTADFSYHSLPTKASLMAKLMASKERFPKHPQSEAAQE